MWYTWTVVFRKQEFMLYIRVCHISVYQMYHKPENLYATGIFSGTLACATAILVYHQCTTDGSGRVAATVAQPIVR